MTSVWDVAADLLDPPDDHWRPLPHQIPPDGDWMFWMLMGGRGAGKTATCARQMHEHVMGPPCTDAVPGGHWMSIIAPTLGDAATSCVNGPSGLRLHCPEIKLRQDPGGTIVQWPNGSIAKLFGAYGPEDVERLRSGGNRCFVWLEEMAAWRYIEECWQHMRYGLRIGDRPRAVISTTPKPRKVIKEINKECLDPENPDYVLTKASTNENPHLPGHVRQMLYDDYGGTRQGRQELDAELLEDIEGALWNADMIERNRLEPFLAPPNYDRLVIGVDPAMSEAGDEHGIVVAGMVRHYMAPNSGEFAHLPHGFVLRDASTSGKPQRWAQAVIDLYHEYNADLVVAERNNGGDLVMSNIHSLDSTIPVKVVWASRGKTKRAQPISNMYEQGRVHHVGDRLSLLEDQMVSWDPLDEDPAWSPDRMDAMVWALWELLTPRSAVMTKQVHDTRLRNRR